MRAALLTITSLLFAASIAAPLPAQNGPDLYELAYSAETDPNAALLQVDVALRDLAAAAELQPGLRYDLLRLKADVLAHLKSWMAAADIVVELAEMAEAEPSLDRDPVPLWSQAAGFYETAGAPDKALDAMRRKLAVEELQGYDEEVLMASRLDLARLAKTTGSEQNRVEEAEGPLALSAGPQSESLPGRRMAQSTKAAFHEVEVYYATDRARDIVAMPATFYGSGRGDLELGVATVSVPDSHTPGIIEAPSIWRLEFSANPGKHVILQSVVPMVEDAFYTRLQAEFRDQGKTEAFVFVHGYNVTFDQAAKRAAQIAYDMDYSGVPILYSWPSKGSAIGYVADTAVVRLSGRRLASFLDELVARSGATTIHIVAHSMGNRALTDALEIIALRRGLDERSKPLFDQILFAAPDVDAGLFVNMIKTIRPIARRLTLYTSDKDWALESSRRLHGNAPRAGQGGTSMLADGNVDSIDMSELGEDMLAHSYFAADRSALADMASLFWRNVAPERRCGLEQRDGQSGVPVWHYRRGACASRGLIDVMAHLRQANASTVEEAQRVLKGSVQDIDMLRDLAPVIEKLMVE